MRVGENKSEIHSVENSHSLKDSFRTLRRIHSKEEVELKLVHVQNSNLAESSTALSSQQDEHKEEIVAERKAFIII